jgi:hypothetical protein
MIGARHAPVRNVWRARATFSAGGHPHRRESPARRLREPEIEDLPAGKQGRAPEA